MHFIYIALFKTLKVALQSQVFIQTQSYRWCRSEAAIQHHTAPLTTNIHSTFIRIHTHVFMMVGETGVPGGNPRRHGENM